MYDDRNCQFKMKMASTSVSIVDSISCITHYRYGQRKGFFHPKILHKNGSSFSLLTSDRGITRKRSIQPIKSVARIKVLTLRCFFHPLYSANLEHLTYSGGNLITEGMSFVAFQCLFSRKKVWFDEKCCLMLYIKNSFVLPRLQKKSRSTLTTN